LKTKIRGFENATNDVTQASIREQLQTLSNITKKPGANQTGSFVARVTYILKKSEENGIMLQADIPRLAI
jgi:hypothetical protein